MRRKGWIWQISLVLFVLIASSFCAMTRKQLQSSFDMMRSACAPKYQVSVELLDGLRRGEFVEDKELKCYTFCIAQMAGTITKKNEISLEKAVKQIEVMAPVELRDLAIETAKLCKDIQKQYKDPCDKTFYSTKCTYELQPQQFLFP